MNNQGFTSRRAILIGLVAAILGLAVAPDFASAQDEQPKTTRIYLVRHAEKVDDSRDPELSDAGKERAQHLAERLKDAEITFVYTTPYIRTRDTARPTAKAVMQELREFNPPEPGDAAEAWAKQLLQDAAGANVLVVAHSGRADQRGSVPSLVQALGGEEVATITDAEYFNLYIVTITSSDDSEQIDIKREKYGVVPDDGDGDQR